MKISSMKYLFGQGVKNVWTNRIMTFASFCVILVSLLLVGSMMLFTANVNRFISGIESKNEVVVYLNDGVTDETVSQMETDIKKLDNVAEVVFYSKEQAFEDYKKSMENAEEIFESIGDESPLPDAFKIRVKDISKMTSTIAQINKMQNIYKVSAPNDFADLLIGIKSTVGMISTAVIAALGIVCLVIISNATRASVFARRKEINIMKYVGATNMFIRIPFFVEGMVTGMLAGVAAAGLTWFGYEKFIEALSKQMTLWKAFGIDEFIPFDSVVVKVVLGYVGAGALLGAIGTVISTRKHLKV
ncbi:MAG TPA: permease-like cell division protein FtsX [Oscillospiraceae bacterium]|nr:permease-like cell division protein FtsX [Oscillospiraceae bacterium]